MRAFVRWFEPAMEVVTILDREYNRVGGAEVIKLHQLSFEFGAIGFFFFFFFLYEILMQ